MVRGLKIIAATKNKGKLKEIKDILSEFGFDILSMDEAGINIDVEETGKTFEENAYIKAKAIQDIGGTAAISDDSGLCVDALQGAPGVYSARYAGEPSNDEKNNKLLLCNLKKVSEPFRTARFVSAVCMAFPDGSYITVRGECGGKIGFEEKGREGFGYDPLFYPDGFEMTYAQLSSSQKNKISHRYRAFCRLKEELEKRGY
ncbi:dITP/XTP pyrophosphatase [bioreactor metagenome]|uniref:dITP/XTP pyrophosphatase n=1 Tax=bioreactor metagenome TaxID=1076179 RepID=A0A645AYV2_9ZZZZ